MLTRRRPPHRRTVRQGVALAELVIATAMLGVVGAVAAAAIAQQGRVRDRIAWRASAAIQAREAIAPLMADLASVSPSAGDIPPGGARDSTLEVRIAAASGYLCGVDTADTRRILVAPLGRGADVDAGDSAWLYLPVPGSDSARWQSYGVVRAAPARSTATFCGATPGGGARVLDVTLDRDGTLAALPSGTPVRATRRVRYAFYRSSDGIHLGLREWSTTSNGFATVQPVAGPFARGSLFRYVDTLGAPVASGALVTADIGGVEVLLVSESPGGPGRPARTIRAGVTVAFRNRP